MHLIELTRAIHVEREQALRRGWPSGSWAALRHPRADRGPQAEDAVTGASRPVRLVMLSGR